MREIKFRVWNIDEYISLNKAIHDDIVVIQQPSSSNDSLIEINWEGVELEQYTGMRDGDGKDIYEFDIVLFNDGEFSFYGVVNFSEYGYVISIDDKNKESLFEFNTPELKVIGNIHQHAYLLEQNKC